MKPPTGGPMRGPISAGMVSQAIAVTSSALGAVRRITRRPTGTIMAPPAPCTTRESTTESSVVERPQSIEPSVNTTIAAENTLRAPNLSAAQPESGMNTASARRYEVSASFSATGSSCRSAAIAGRAVESTVPSRFSIKSAVATMSGVSTVKEVKDTRLSGGGAFGRERDAWLAQNCRSAQAALKARARWLARPPPMN